MSRPTWDEYFLGIAKAVAARADCTRSQVGAVVVAPDIHRVLATGYNGAEPAEPGCLTSGACPRGQLSYEEFPALLPYDNCIALHAERNAILFAGGAATGAWLYVTREPCKDCWTLIYRFQIERVIWPDKGKWEITDGYRAAGS